MSGSRHSDDQCKNKDVRSSPPAAFLISVAGSAGALASLKRILALLTPECPAAMAVAVHSRPGSVLVEALSSQSRLCVEWARSGVVLQAARVYVAPGGAHLIVNPDARLTVSHAPRIRLFRPSVDWLFDSAAASFDTRHVAIVLSGMLSDGAFTLRHVKRVGGAVLVQDPRTCPYPDMPQAAIATGQFDAILPPDEIAAAALKIFAEREALAALWDDPFGVGSLAS